MGRRGHEKKNRISERVELELASIDCSHAEVVLDMVFFEQKIFFAQSIGLGKVIVFSLRKFERWLSAAALKLVYS